MRPTINDSVDLEVLPYGMTAEKAARIARTTERGRGNWLLLALAFLAFLLMITYACGYLDGKEAARKELLTNSL